MLGLKSVKLEFYTHTHIYRHTHIEKTLEGLKVLCQCSLFEW